MNRKVVFAMVATALMALVTLALVQAPANADAGPGLAHRFVVEIDDMDDLNVREVYGIHCETGIAEFFEGEEDTSPTLLPALTRCGPIVLRRVLTEDTQLADWYTAVMDGEVDRRDGAIMVLDGEDNVVATYAFFDAWPAAYGTDPLLAFNEIDAIEEVVLAVERIERVE